MAKCRSCGTDIDWITTRLGKKIPLNMDGYMMVPAKDGDRVGVTSDGRVIIGIRVGDAYEGEDAVFVRTAHFATCPKASEWRK